MTMLPIFSAIILPAFTLVTSVGGLCTFPKDIRGKWYQAGLGDVIIKHSDIEHKGVCMQSDNAEKYMVTRRDGRCNQCMLILLRHHNVIQYKEGYCVEKSTLADVCRELKVEAILYTMVRVPSIPEACPFQEAYKFTYNNNSRGLCQKPESYVKPCAGTGKAKLSFQQCNGVLDTYEQEMHLDCLGHWKDGSNMYMYGALHKSVVISRDDTYRCFLYQSYGSQTRRMSMSADASCRGLSSPTDGPLIMNLDRDTVGWPDAGCRYPDWLSGSPWQDLTHKHEYLLDDGKFIVKYRRAGARQAPVKHEYRCLQEMSISDKDSSFIFLGLATHAQECKSEYRCMKLVKRGDNVVEFITGQRLGSSTDTCKQSHLNYETAHHFIYRPQSVPVSCPIQGRYQVEMPGIRCDQATMDAGCNTSNVLQLHSCNSKYDWSVTCLATWTDAGKSFFVVTKTKSGDDNTADGSFKTANCISVEKSEDATELNFDDLCNKDLQVIGDKNKYVLANNPTSCGRRRVLSGGGHESLGDSEYGYESGGEGYGSGRNSAHAHTCHSALQTLSVIFLCWICVHRTLSLTS